MVLIFIILVCTNAVNYSYYLGFSYLIDGNWKAHCILSAIFSISSSVAEEGMVIFQIDLKQSLAIFIGHGLSQWNSLE